MKESDSSPQKKRKKESNLRSVSILFSVLILLGAVLLFLPFSLQEGKSISFLDSLFISASATCVTGLATVNVGETFSNVGLVIILVLIQLGGMGIFTAGILLVVVSGQSLSLSDEHRIRSTMGRLRDVKPLKIFLYFVFFVFFLEAIGALLMFSEMWRVSDVSCSKLIFDSIFHSVSSFCNAGISNYPEGMVRWKGNPLILSIVDILVILGSLEMLTLINLRYFYFWKRSQRERGHLNLQTKLTILATVILLILGTLLTFVFEKNYTLKDIGLGESISWSFFHSTMRTSGFNVVDVGSMNPVTLFVTIFLMFVGGSPGSMAGGIKSITLAILLLAAWSAIRRKENIQIFGRRISIHLANVAMMITLLASIIIFLGIGLLFYTEQGHPSSEIAEHWLGIAFEAVSAFGTVGLSMGVTPFLSVAGKIIIIILMFVGRVLPLILAMHLATPTNPCHVKTAKEDLILG